jgi:hypothetical protein
MFVKLSGKSMLSTASLSAADHLLTNHLMVIQYMALVVGNAVLTPLLPLLITQYHPNKLQ